MNEWFGNLRKIINLNFGVDSKLKVKVMEKSKIAAILKKWILCANYFFWFLTLSQAQFFTDTYLVNSQGSNVSIQDVLIDGETSYIYGTYTAAMTFEGVDFSHQGSSDVFLLKRINGITEWILFGGSAGNDFVSNLAFDESNNVVLGGSFTNEATFGPLTLESSGSSRTIFVITLSPDGDILEHQIVNGTGQKDIIGIEVVNNQIYIAGTFGDTLFMDDVNAVSTSNEDIFIMKLQDNTAPAWIENYGLEGNNETNDFSWNEPSQQFIISGQYDRKISVASDTIVTNTFDEDLFLAAFNLDGSGKWIRKLGGQLDDINEAHTTDEQGNIYLTGEYRGIINFDDGTQINTGGIGNSDAYLIKCNAQGDKVWARTLGDAGNETGTDLIIEGDRIYWSCFYNKTFSIDGITFTEPNGFQAGAFGIFNIDDGQLEAKLTANSNSLLIPQGIATNTDGIVLYGEFSGEASFDQVFNVESFAGFATQINLQSVSTDAITKEVDINVFPNPFSDVVNISFGDKARNVQIYSASGQLIYESAASLQNHEINLTEQVNGIYFWISDDGKTGKVVKN